MLYIGEESHFNISYEKGKLCIVKLGWLNMVFFKPIPYGYPSIKGFEYFSQLDKNKYLD